MDEPRARGVSLWLMPEGAVREGLAALINRLAVRLGTAAFAPHVTLLPGLPGPEAEVIDRARALAAALKPLPMALSGVDGLDAHFRCLFFGVVESLVLREGHSRAARCFGREPDASFDPHLSLVYGSLGAGPKAELKRELSREVPPSFDVRCLHVWRTEGRVREWRELTAIELGADV